MSDEECILTGDTEEYRKQQQYSCQCHRHRHRNVRPCCRRQRSLSKKKKKTTTAAAAAAAVFCFVFLWSTLLLLLPDGLLVNSENRRSPPLFSVVSAYAVVTRRTKIHQWSSSSSSSSFSFSSSSSSLHRRRIKGAVAVCLNAASSPSSSSQQEEAEMLPKSVIPKNTLKQRRSTTTVTTQKQRRTNQQTPPPRRLPKQHKGGRGGGASSNGGGVNGNDSNIDNAGVQESIRLNQRIVAAPNAQSVLQVLQETKGALTQYAGGGKLTCINFSTSIHRLARHSLSSTTSADGSHRAVMIMDARFALFLAAMAEAMVSSTTSSSSSPSSSSTAAPPIIITFASRDLSNIAWALAKLKIAPPATAMPLVQNLDEGDELILRTAANIRAAVVQAARDRAAATSAASGATAASSSSTSSSSSSSWVALVSQLAGLLLDDVRVRGVMGTQVQGFRQQEMSNLLWAWATANRVDKIAFGAIVQRMIQQVQQQQGNGASTTSVNSSGTSRKKDYEPRRPQEWSNSVWALATAQVYQGHVELLEQVAFLMETDRDFMQAFKPQEISNTLWGLASLLSNKAKETSLTAREEAAALSILRQSARAIVQQGKIVQFKTQELANSLWAMATLGFGLWPSPEHALNNYVVLNSHDQTTEDAKLMHAAVNAIVQASQQVLFRFRSQELNNLAWALARLVGSSSSSSISSSNNIYNSHPESRQAIESLLTGIGHQLQNPKRRVSSQDIGTTLWSMATMEFFDDDIYRGIAARLTPDRATGFKPQELSNSLWAMATAGIKLGKDKDAFDTSLVPEAIRPRVQDPVTRCFAIAADELMRRPHEFKSQEIKDVLWSFSKVGIRHPRLFKRIAEHLVGGDSNDNDDGDNNTNNNYIKQEPLPPRSFDSYSPQGLGNTAWAYARQAQLSEEVVDRLGKGAFAASMSNGRLAVYTTSYLDIGETLLHRFFSSLAEADLRLHDNLSKLKPQDLSNTAWTFAVLGLRHSAFCEAAKRQLVERLERLVAAKEGKAVATARDAFKGQELSNLLWSLATLDIPAGDILSYVGEYMHKICEDENGKVTVTAVSKMCKRQELANMAWSCAVFDEYPPKLMDLIYKGLVGEGKEQDPAYMSRLFDDSGLQDQAIMTLIYVQAAVDRAGGSTSGALSLPPDFPDGWQIKSASSECGQHVTEPTFDLKLSTSKIQRSVSDTFRRIGFEHDEEHVITMEEMAVEYGINVAPKPMEILSIDIANVADKIAIEVDGPSHFVSIIDNVHHSDDAPQSEGFGWYNKDKLEYQYMWNGDRQHINGPTALKERLLISLGWRVIHLPFWEWYTLGGDPDAQEEYCRNLLKTRL